MANAEESSIWWSEDDVRATLPKRKESAHKGTYGTGLLLAGSKEMPGAALLSGMGALRSGIGKLVIGTDKEVISYAVSLIPEATYLSDGLKKVRDGIADLNSYKAIAAGPGIESDSMTEAVVEELLKSECPVILDAGALFKRSYPENRQAPVILTPHPGEFSRITGMNVTDIQMDRAHHAILWAKKLGVTIVLKGHESIIAFPDGELYKNPTGSSSLAKGGTGDTLTGMMLGMLCCHEEKDWKHAVLNAVYLHGACGQKWSETRSPHTLLAHELTELLPEVWKRFE